jgi:Flp pilus assembly protein TadD
LFTQDKDLEKAVDAFSRAVQIDPENGEAWNNLACLYVLAFCIYSFVTMF